MLAPGAERPTSLSCLRFPPSDTTWGSGVSRSPALLLCVPLCLAARVQLSPDTLTNVNLLPPQGLGTGVRECHGNSCLGEGKAPVVFSPSCRQQSSSSLFSWIRLVKRSTSPVTKVCGAGEVMMC